MARKIFAPESDWRIWSRGSNGKIFRAVSGPETGASGQAPSDVERGADPGFKRTGRACLWREPVKNAKVTLFRAYAIFAVLTFLFQIFVRIPQCADTGGCAISLGKGLLWSII